MKIEIKAFAKKFGLNISNFEGNHYNGNLDLRGTGITSLPEGLTVGGYLDLSGTGITSLPEGLTVGGNLDLRGTGITSLPEGLTVGGSLYLSGTGITSLPEGLTVGGYLDLSGTGITSLPEGLTVGGSIYLRGTGITSLPEGLTVGGSLYLSGTGITSLPEGLTVGGNLDLRGTGITSPKYNKLPEGYIFSWKNGKYIKADGIFLEVISKMKNVYKCRYIRGKEVYLVVDGDKCAHGDTIAEARKDLIYKIGNRDKSAYEGMTRDTVLSFEQSIECYRVITGACAAGCRGFVERLDKVKKSYTIAEIIKLTEGQYGNYELKSFFSK